MLATIHPINMPVRTQYLDHDQHSRRLSDGLLEDTQPMELVMDSAELVVAVYKKIFGPAFSQSAWFNPKLWLSTLSFLWLHSPLKSVY